MDFIKKNFISVVVLILLVLILLQRCGDHKVESTKPTITVIRDTQWYTHRDTIPISSPIPIKTIPYILKTKDTFFIPDTNYVKLRSQFDSLRDMFLAENIYKQSIKQDSSSVDVTDTVFKNRILGSKYIFNLKYPIIKDCTIVKEPYKPVNQLYIGGAIGGGKLNLVNSVETGLIYKTKSDKLFQGKVNIDLNGNVTYGVGTYWKLSLKK